MKKTQIVIAMADVKPSHNVVSALGAASLRREGRNAFWTGTTTPSGSSTWSPLIS
ncbi:hypothetical protein [Nocardioides sp. Kera G14]|uniref:hypothetical protein n=1 Tax=Nocardioides sp. Kera G14 TaxID=2884264 RepID=UPI001D10A9F8|nr:hypothetical protein [Nocardioides sp. Kera G14]UDY24601.1 hypothetical protein LH076_04655 [Nocardioides sp. Kera G14]